MASNTLAICLLLFLASTNALLLENNIYHVEKPPSDQYLLSPGLIRGDSFVFATTNKTDNPSSTLTINVITSYSSTKYRQCPLTLRASLSEGVVGVNSLQRMGGSRVLIETYEQNKEGNRYTTLILVDMEICKITLPLPAQLSDAKDTLITGYNIYFDLFTGHETICKNVSEKCRIKYRKQQTVESIKTDLVWSNLIIEPTLWNDIFVMRGYNKIGTYQVELYDFERNERKELASFSDVEKMQIVTSNLAVCWIPDVHAEKTTVNCLKYSKRGELLFNSTVTYEERVSIMYLHNDRRSKMVLIVGNQKDNEWNVILTVLESDDLSKPKSDHAMNLTCAGTDREIVFDALEINGMLKIEYICLDRDNKFIYNSISLLDQ